MEMRSKKIEDGGGGIQEAGGAIKSIPNSFLKKSILNSFLSLFYILEDISCVTAID